MTHFVRILLPKFYKTNNVFFKGYVINEDICIKIFITTYDMHPENDFLYEGSNTKNNTIYGYYNLKPDAKNVLTGTPNYLIIEENNYLKIKKCIIQGQSMKLDKIILLLYDYNLIKNTETIFGSDDFIPKLKQLIQTDLNISNDLPTYNPLVQSPNWLLSSMFIKHIINYINLLSWLFLPTPRKDKMSIQHLNLVFAIIIDIFLGYLILELIIFDEKEVATILLQTLEKLVNLMYSLLKWLMGAPAGLKLNNAFNKMLGKYFLYHVELWWLFLDVSSAKLDAILRIYQYLGYLGLTFQAAIISDMICLATFHSYCIYVYAARLFNIQISGLIALLRLFVGRKYNPLRGGIDSCEYTNQELFVGTVAFTILLLLLPTTLMYYIVFTMFRIVALLVQYILAKVIYIIQCTPFYAFLLWLTRSSKIAGNVLIEEVTPKNSPILILNVKLLNKGIGDLMINFKPPVDILRCMEWTNVATNVFTGDQII